MPLPLYFILEALQPKDFCWRTSDALGEQGRRVRWRARGEGWGGAGMEGARGGSVEEDTGCVDERAGLTNKTEGRIGAAKGLNLKKFADSPLIVGCCLDIRLLK